jgi:hypothetical protein
LPDGTFWLLIVLSALHKKNNLQCKTLNSLKKKELARRNNKILNIVSYLSRSMDL